MMLNSKQPDSELVTTILEPLLEDFQYWFQRSRQLLETEDIACLAAEQQADLLARVVAAQSQVQTVQTLLQATDGKVGVEVAVLTPWHQLVMECWQVAMQHRGKNP